MRKPFSKSLSLRLLAIFIVTTVLILILITQLFSRGLGAQWRQTIQPHLVQYVNYVHSDLGTPPRADAADALASQLPVQIHIYDSTKQLVHTTADQQPDLSQLHFRPLGRRAVFKYLNPSDTDGEKQKSTPAKLPVTDIAFDESHLVTVLRVKKPEHTVYYELQTRSRNWRHGDYVFTTLIALVGILGLSYWIIRRELSPIRKIQRSVQHMANGELDHRVPVDGRDDLALLGNSINDMAQRIQQMLNAKHQLLIAISHELRSPLARAKVASAMLPDGKNTERLKDDLVDMEMMINDIMESERLQHHSALQTQSVNVNKLIWEVIDSTDHPVQTNLPKEQININADEIRLAIMLRNVINNAITHGKGTGQQQAIVNVTLSVESNKVLLNISDQGAGIQAEHLHAVTDAFFRTDASRTRTTGGFGMGLTLARLIAEAHQGSLSISSEPDVRPGTTVTIMLPLD